MMNAEQKVEAIKEMIGGLEAEHMTTLELNIRDVVEEKVATKEEEESARMNTTILTSAIC